MPLALERISTDLRLEGEGGDLRLTAEVGDMTVSQRDAGRPAIIIYRRPRIVWQLAPAELTDLAASALEDDEQPPPRHRHAKRCSRRRLPWSPTVRPALRQRRRRSSHSHSRLRRLRLKPSARACWHAFLSVQPLAVVLLPPPWPGYRSRRQRVERHCFGHGSQHRRPR